MEKKLRINADTYHVVDGIYHEGPFKTPSVDYAMLESWNLEDMKDYFIMTKDEKYNPVDYFEYLDSSHEYVK